MRNCQTHSASFKRYQVWDFRSSLRQISGASPRGYHLTVDCTRNSRNMEHALNMVTRDLTTATAKGSLQFPGSLLQGNCSPIAASQLSWYMWYPRTIASMLNFFFIVISASQLVQHVSRQFNYVNGCVTLLRSIHVIAHIVAASEWQTTILNP